MTARTPSHWQRWRVGAVLDGLAQMLLGRVQVAAGDREQLGRVQPRLQDPILGALPVQRQVFLNQVAGFPGTPGQQRAEGGEPGGSRWSTWSRTDPPSTDAPVETSAERSVDMSAETST
jgi:hypothetical protein